MKSFLSSMQIKTKEIMKKTFLLHSLFIFSLSANAQLPTIAPNFIAEDINGVEYNLYEILGSGRAVILDFSATWCGACWEYQETGIMHDFYELAGPNGSNTALNFFVESDASTTMDDLMGTGPSTVGDWVTGTNYPILDDSGVAAVFGMSGFPTVLMVCPDRSVTHVGWSDADSLVSLTNNCASLDFASEPFFRADLYDGCGDNMEVQFTDNSWPPPTDYLWDFGDGNTSTEQHPIHNYEEAGDYSVTLSVTNDFGSNELQKQDMISLGLGSENENMPVGPVDNTFGDGGIYTIGSQGLYFDVMNPMVISSVKVYASGAAIRRIILKDEFNNTINSREIMIPDGESRINLDFFADAGYNYLLTMESDAFLFRNSNSAVYPMTLDNLVSITGSTASSPGYYYFFYDWEVREAGCDGETGTSDNQGPDFSGTPSFVSLPCDDFNAFNEITASPSDPCTPVTLSFNDINTGLGCTGGNITRTYSAIDDCGNVSTFTQTISFTDSTPPIFTYVPADITTTCDSELTDLESATASDNCSQVNITIDVVLVGGPCPAAYEVHRTFSSFDDCGNTSSALQIIYIEASVVVGCPEDVDGDGAVTVSDLLAILSEFGCSTGCQYDINQDGLVGVGDILEVLAAFGDAC